MDLSPDMVEFGAVLVKVCIKDFAFALLIFAVFVVGMPQLVSPAALGSPCGQAKSVVAWVRAVFAVDLAAVRATGGLDAELYVRRIHMRLAQWAELGQGLSRPLRTPRSPGTGPTRWNSINSGRNRLAISCMDSIRCQGVHHGVACAG